MVIKLMWAITAGRVALIVTTKIIKTHGRLEEEKILDSGQMMVWGDLIKRYH